MHTYNVGVVAGRFRLVHKAHRELLIKAYALTKELHVIINDDESVHRIGDVQDTRIAISKILQSISGHGEKPNVHIHITKNLSGEAWDKEVLQLVPNIDVIFNSKEDYKNIHIKSTYLELTLGKHISASLIESDFIKYRHLIADEFMPAINKRIVITGIESCGKTSLTQKLAMYFDTSYSSEYGRLYSEEFMALDEDSFRAHDFTYIAMEQLMQNKRVNETATGLLFIDSDTIVTKYYMGLYGDEKAGYDTSKFQDDIHLIDTLIHNYMKDIDLVIYLEPNVPFVDDGLRFLDDEDERLIRNQQLKDMYRHYGVDFVTLNNSNYDDTLYEAIHLVESTFQTL